MKEIDPRCEQCGYIGGACDGGLYEDLMIFPVLVCHVPKEEKETFVCRLCHKPATDSLSHQEFRSSGLCQSCRDEVSPTPNQSVKSTCKF